jgi:pSer/pThr/pTyr-binding forkhead associated (FHA) protein
MAEILVKFQDKVVERVVTEKPHLTIGRTPDNDIVLDNRGVSRRHAQIDFSPEGALIIDNDSLNGTFVNQRKISEHFLHNSDTITIGKFDLIFCEDGEPTGPVDMEGTMILNTKKQKEMLGRDQEERELTSESGAALLLELRGKSKLKHPLNEETTTCGRSGVVDVRTKGLFTSGLQAKIVKDDDGYTIENVGRRQKTRVNGESVSSRLLRNGDIVEIGKSTFRFITRD